MKYLPLFILIQVVSLVLLVFGVLVVAFLVIVGLGHVTSVDPPRMHFPAWAWIWDNEEDGITGPARPISRWSIFYWSALRNSCNNLRFVQRLLWLPIKVSAVGRPLFLKQWMIRGKEFYFKAGWLTDGYPVLSWGSGRGW